MSAVLNPFYRCASEAEQPLLTVGPLMSIFTGGCWTRGQGGPNPSAPWCLEHGCTKLGPPTREGPGDPWYPGVCRSLRDQVCFQRRLAGSGARDVVLSESLCACACHLPGVSPPRRVTRARLLPASKGHMPPCLAENRKPHGFEGSPVIHQGMTVQLFVPILCSGVTVQDSFLPGLPFPAAWRSRAGLDSALSPLEAAWPDSVWAKFLFIFPAFFGAGRLWNVECRNVGKRAVGKREPGLWPCLSFLPLCRWRLQPPLDSLPRSLARPVSVHPVVSLRLLVPWTLVLGHTSSLG